MKGYKEGKAKAHKSLDEALSYLLPFLSYIVGIDRRVVTDRRCARPYTPHTPRTVKPRLEASAVTD